MVIERARAAVATRMDELWPLLASWVDINSHTANRAGCDRVADALDAAFALPGLVAKRVPGDGAGDHVTYATDAFASGAGTILVGHHDTVFPPGTFEGFRRDDERCHGPGVLDMKGGLAVIRTALAALADIGALADLPIAVVSVSDEETGSVDGRRAIEAIARGAARGLVFEAGRPSDALVTLRKGTGKLQVVAKGRAAHAGNEIGNGINAIWALARLIDAVQRVPADLGERITLNVGLVSGGSAANTVPANARCEIDVRVARAQDAPRLLAAIDQIARALEPETGATFAITGGLRRQPLEHLPGTPALAARYEACARAEGLGGGDAGLVGGGSDANTLAELGIPVIDGLGPRGRGYHTHNEHAEIVTFVPRVMALVRFLTGERRDLA
jgi:glutamate carboxypeptidase